jgi:2,3-bisphosphoglycerate-independent phosphoglycerate mutase
MNRPEVLIVLDGWGYREGGRFNAIESANTPNWDRLWASCPHTLLQASAGHVGLPDEQMGNSEVGHLNLGAGRVVYQDYTRINLAIETGEFAANPVLTAVLDQARAGGGAVHVLGLLSPGGVHSHQDQIIAMLEMAARRGTERLYLHAFLDGRDTPPRSALASVALVEDHLTSLGRGRIASVVGRYYAMDRDRHWQRTQAAYQLLTAGRGEHTAASAREAVESAYARGENDEFVHATAIVPPGQEPVTINDGDAVIMMNFRADRARQITQAFIDPVFDGFQRDPHPQALSYVCLTEYQADFDAPVAFPPEELLNVFGECLARAGMRQLRLAETEKYAHVTFFFNGGREKPFPGEERVLIPSPRDVATYDEKPEMSAPQVTDALVHAITTGGFDAIICNFANADMVGHSGRFEAAVQAIEAIDRCLGRIIDALSEHGGEMLITADHGNAEQLYDDATGQNHTAHTTNPVPLVFFGRPGSLKEGGSLQDIAPTLLTLLGLPIPGEMTGKPLLQLREAPDSAPVRRHQQGN